MKSAQSPNGDDVRFEVRDYSVFDSSGKSRNVDGFSGTWLIRARLSTQFEPCIFEKLLKLANSKFWSGMTPAAIISAFEASLLSDSAKYSKIFFHLRGYGIFFITSHSSSVRGRFAADRLVGFRCRFSSVASPVRGAKVTETRTVISVLSGGVFLFTHLMTNSATAFGNLCLRFSFSIVLLGSPT